jgi:hypothetical protein
MVARGFRLPFVLAFGLAGYVYAAERLSGWQFWALYFAVIPFILATLWIEALTFIQSVSAWRSRSRSRQTKMLSPTTAP